MRKNLAKRISAGILATIFGMGIGYCDSVWAKNIYITDVQGIKNLENSLKNSFQDNVIKINVDKSDTVEVHTFFAHGDVDAWGDTSEKNIKNNQLIIEDGNFRTTLVPGTKNYSLEIKAGYSFYGNAEYNTLIINDGNFSGESGLLLAGGGSIGFIGEYKILNNTVEINGGSYNTDYTEIYGGYTLGMNAEENTVNINGGEFNSSVNNISGSGTSLEVLDESIVMQNSTFVGNNNAVNINGGMFNGDVSIYGSISVLGNLNANKVNLKEGEFKRFTNVYGGYIKCTSAITKEFEFGVSRNLVNIAGSKFNGITNIYGVCLDLDDNATYSGNIVDNKVEIDKNAGNLQNVNLYGYKVVNNNTINGKIDGNDLIIDDWQGKVNSVNNFNNIKFQNLNWQNGGTVLEIDGDEADSSLANTNINLVSMTGGHNINIGDYMYIIKSDDTLDTDKDKISVEQDFTAGVTIDGTGEVIRDDNGNIKFAITGTSINEQINLVAENRAVASAFVNQGTDLINDSLDVLSRDGKYGVKTFAAVHGNRSKYDVNSDLKINGWSSIVGVGNEKNIGNGDFSWGVFYENGSGNYRTYNEFNNEFFRGDGSLVYNGGGIAARFEQDNGVYTEGSLRAGMLKSEMTNALKDGAGNSYGYKSESTYYGAHLGVGKIISLNEATDLDVYGKFFHTYTDGDSFAVANDKFEFDSITSDRLRIGARLTTNKENKFSTYYGLAYEYEFNGDADMRAQNMSAPEQSLKGSSCMAEIGMNYKPSSESPWSFDLSMRGYAGQRDGFSGNVQATYTF